MTLTEGALAFSFCASCTAVHSHEQQTAQSALRSQRWRIVLHLEQRPTRTKLRPTPVSPIDLQDKLRRILKAIDAHPKVVDRNNLHPDLCWTVSSLPARLGP